jgi:hypothetical protein
MDNMQVIERLSRIEASAVLAAQACDRASGVPHDLGQALADLEHWSHEARRWVQNDASEEAEDPARLFECADVLKHLADQAARDCTRAPQLPTELRAQIEAAQTEIAQFRRQLHGHEPRRVARPASRMHH